VRTNFRWFLPAPELLQAAQGCGRRGVGPNVGKCCHPTVFRPLKILAGPRTQDFKSVSEVLKADGFPQKRTLAERLGMSALYGGFNRSTQHLLILLEEEVCDGGDCTDMVHAAAEG
jgi:hypothetical protein